MRNERHRRTLDMSKEARKKRKKRGKNGEEWKGRKVEGGRCPFETKREEEDARGRRLAVPQIPRSLALYVRGRAWLARKTPMATAGEDHPPDRRTQAWGALMVRRSGLAGVVVEKALDGGLAQGTRARAVERRLMGGESSELMSNVLMRVALRGRSL